jgi:hypothetical protein
VQAVLEISIHDWQMRKKKIVSRREIGIQALILVVAELIRDAGRSLPSKIDAKGFTLRDQRVSCSIV